MGNRKNMPNKEQIVDFHRKWLGDRFFDGYLVSLPVMEKCFRCGFPHVQRCHILPVCLGGSNALDNLVLLCAGCHQIQETMYTSNEITKIEHLSEFFDSEFCYSGLDMFIDSCNKKLEETANKIEKELSETPLFSETMEHYKDAEERMMRKIQNGYNW